MGNFEILMNVINDKITSATVHMRECIDDRLMDEMLFWNIISNTCHEIIREYGMRCAETLAEECDKKNSIMDAIAKGAETALSRNDGMQP